MKNLVKCINDTVKAVIFDLDGLLVETEIISYQIYKLMLEPFGYSFTKEEYAQGYSGKTGIENMNNIISKYHLPYSLEEGLKIEEDIENQLLANGVMLKRGAKELLAYLKENHYKIGLATSSTKDRALLILHQHNIENYFDAFTFGFEVEKGKPNPDIFLKAAEKLNEVSQNCLVLEDSEAGIQASYSAKIPVICIPDMKYPAEEFLDKTYCVLSSLDKVIDILSK